MRARSTFGPQEWSPEVIRKVALQPEDNDHRKVDRDIVERWKEYQSASRGTDAELVRELIEK